MAVGADVQGQLNHCERCDSHSRHRRRCVRCSALIFRRARWPLLRPGRSARPGALPRAHASVTRTDARAAQRVDKQRPDHRRPADFRRCSLLCCCSLLLIAVAQCSWARRPIRTRIPIRHFCRRMEARVMPTRQLRIPIITCGSHAHSACGADSSWSGRLCRALISGQCSR